MNSQVTVLQFEESLHAVYLLSAASSINIRYFMVHFPSSALLCTLINLQSHRAACNVNPSQATSTLPSFLTEAMVLCCARWCSLATLRERIRDGSVAMNPERVLACCRFIRVHNKVCAKYRQCNEQHGSDEAQEGNL